MLSSTKFYRGVEDGNKHRTQTIIGSDTDTMIYTACPECKKVFNISIQELSETRAISYCDACEIKFDALELLSDTLADSEISTPEIELNKKTDLLGFKYNPEIAEHDGPLPWEEKNPISASKLWLPGSIAGLLLLLAQVSYFEFHHYSQSPETRPWLKSLCQIINCQLPAYSNPDKIKVLQGSLLAISEDTYELHTVFTNQAKFAQPFPKVKLTLLTLSGSPLATRTFTMQEYFPQKPRNALLTVDHTAELSLNIVKPSSAIGGYTIELI